MATLLEAYNLRHQTITLRSRVIAAVAKKAIDVLNEVPATENHAARLTWAKATLADAGTTADKIMWAVIADAAILAAGDSATDTNILTAVANAINAFAQ
jgi:hypothetical protein